MSFVFRYVHHEKRQKIRSAAFFYHFAFSTSLEDSVNPLALSKNRYFKPWQAHFGHALPTMPIYQPTSSFTGWLPSILTAHGRAILAGRNALQ